MAEIITFYKELQPAFPAEIRYHELCYYVTMFQPTESIPELTRFLGREITRKDRYIEENKDLYDYYTLRHTHRDEELFADDPVDADR